MLHGHCKRTFRGTIRAAAVVATLLLACDGTSTRNTGGESGSDALATPGHAGTGIVGIRYRGQRRTAAWKDGVLLLEGDIEVVATDTASEAERTSSEKPGAVRNGLHIVGGSYNWGGTRGGLGFAAVPAVVPFEIDGAFSSWERSAIEHAMDRWTADAPGVSFRPAVSTDSDRIKFERTTNTCSSPVGRVGGTQIIRLAPGCFDFAIHHEIAHSLGLYHEQSRPDRSDFVEIEYKNIRGCRSNAKGPDQCGWFACLFNETDCGCVDGEDCYVAFNFDMQNDAAMIGGYDYDSIMHYGPRGFSKNGLPTIRVLTPGRTIGNRRHLSEGDIAKMRVLYPTQLVHETYFANSGRYPLCRLLGREEDLATEAIASSNGARLPFVSADGSIDTSFLIPGAQTPVECYILSNLWGATYSYPNATVPYRASGYVDLYGSTRTLTVLDPGLIAVLF